MNTARDYPSAPAGLAKRTPPPGTLSPTTGGTAGRDRLMTSVVVLHAFGHISWHTMRQFSAGVGSEKPGPWGYCVPLISRLCGMINCSIFGWGCPEQQCEGTCRAVGASCQQRRGKQTRGITGLAALPERLASRAPRPAGVAPGLLAFTNSVGAGRRIQ